MEEGSLELSENAINALREFYREQREEEDRFKALAESAESQFSGSGSESAAISINDFKENWQLSQFWYDDDTCTALAEEIIRQRQLSGLETYNVACISAPSVFAKLREMKVSFNVFLLENDTRFEAFGKSFVFYDYKRPTTIACADSVYARECGVSMNLASSFDLLLVDPPFLSEECWSKTSETVTHMSKISSLESGLRSTDTKVIVCTGAVMQSAIQRLILGYNGFTVHETSFLPRHRNGLANEFKCFANYLDSFDSMKGR